MKRRGFTIVELLIVIVVIAILAAITIVAYNGIQQRAQVSALYSGIKQVDKSLRLYLTEQGDSTWPKDTEIDPSVPSGNAPIASIIKDTGLKQYLQQVPSSGTNWFYDNDGDTLTAGNISGGVNLCIDSITPAVAQALDNEEDDGVLTTGNIRYNGTRLYYSLSTTQPYN